jgi:CrcB protein
MGAAGWVAVAGLSGAAAAARFLMDRAVGVHLGSRFPFGTLIVNLLGSFMLGLLVGVSLSGETLLIAGTATIGSYTTFSTWMLESHRLFEDGQAYEMLANLAMSLIVGLGAVTLGRALGAGL